MPVLTCKKSTQFLLDAFFPKKCLICAKEGDWICEKHHHFPKNKTIYEAQNLKRVKARSFYKHPHSKALVQGLKFYNQKHLAKIIAQELAPMLKEYLEVHPKSVIIAVPLHWKRLLFRGFNQNQLIINELKKIIPEMNIDSKNSLKRITNTRQQARLEKTDRHKNLAKAFLWNGKSPAPTQVLLIDDIMTSGATLSAAANALKKTGTKEVEALVFAHG